MNRRKFLKTLFYSTAAIYLAPAVAADTVSAAVRPYGPGVHIQETYLHFWQLSNRKATDFIVVHHIGGTNRDVSAAEVHQWHLNNGWAGIGYHYLIRKSGVIERGRPRDTVGAHCYGENYHSIGVNVVGDFDGAVPNDAQMASLSMLLAALCRLYRLQPGDATIFGHRDFNDTACPGQNLYDMLPDIRLNVHKHM